MVDRATRYKNAMNQIQERNRPGQTSQMVDVPPDTHERHARSVRPYLACLRPVSPRW